IGIMSTIKIINGTERKTFTRMATTPYNTLAKNVSFPFVSYSSSPNNKPSRKTTITEPAVIPNVWIAAFCILSQWISEQSKYWLITPAPILRFDNMFHHLYSYFHLIQAFDGLSNLRFAAGQLHIQ